MDQKITENFSYYEFGPKGSDNLWLPSNEYQKTMITLLAINLQAVRSAIPQCTSMRITSGVRLASDYDRLKAAGYNPAETSDHNYGNAVQLDVSSSKYKTFGSTYNFSVGAADVVPSGISAVELFETAVQMTVDKKCNFGQIIHEYDKDKGSEWVHFANDPANFLGPVALRLLNRSKFLESSDGGKQYSVYTPKV